MFLIGYILNNCLRINWFSGQRFNNDQRSNIFLGIVNVYEQDSESYTSFMVFLPKKRDLLFEHCTIYLIVICDQTECEDERQIKHFDRAQLWRVYQKYLITIPFELDSPEKNYLQNLKFHKLT
ncbi:hypothetical protein PHYBLDRAFT_66958 [Phycomyces blakesleeanus NRRL 1555(-)]|uniref:Uncharacterized protein n=1 Tax=Phycomyces blakesleeanus (strain ATCC 8743b / DSM 1359 / FGSC 10004 / NBRC 33097 / NRRL 1555) TaxID=763407 RepID=A0A167KTL3_PHYB8|nr:hypothetical protein PHYBLDRAFT_66958 [Phycomyces blakesleeanus NRRL 1555(-)]OAD68848.1 hypothetical protein PHYBLDRAFT_66958 [Phycomyces blakesleeanus NRRL 1555(-)]|eukprot:XP_018286888.1 hypothetical protein PHYBLDRAFT_66958 [Phycomyces blakesleeanus NRRL 1555(-)]